MSDPVKSRIAGLAFAGWCTVSPDGRRLYIIDDASSSMQVIDLTTNPATPLKEIATLPNGDTNGLAFLPDGRRLLATINTSVLAEIDIDIETGSGVVGAVVPVGGNQAFGVAVAPDQAPVAKLRVAAGRIRQSSTFDASASTVTYGKIASYRWEFGDGSKPETTNTPTVKHTYAKAGSFTAEVTETDSAGTSTSKLFTGKMMLRNGGPSAVTTAVVKVATPATAGGSPGHSAAGGANPTPGSGSGKLASTGVAPVGQDIGIAALCVALGAGLVVLGRRRYAAHHRT